MRRRRSSSFVGSFTSFTYLRSHPLSSQLLAANAAAPLFFVGKKLSYADVTFYNVIDQLQVGFLLSSSLTPLCRDSGGCPFPWAALRCISPHTTSGAAGAICRVPL